MLLFLLAGACVFTPQTFAKKQNPVPGDILVKFKDFIPPEQAD